MSSIFQTFKNSANKYPSKIAIIGDSKSYTYKLLLNEINATASYIASISNNKPRVALLSDNAKDLFCITMAIAKLGGVCVPTNPSLTSKQLHDSFKATDVNIVFYDSFYSRKLESNYHDIKSVKISDTKGFSVINDTDTIELDHNKQDFLITLSSGSTGIPKPIVLSQDVKLKRAQQTWDIYNLRPEDKILCASPFYHSLGQRLFFVPLLYGATLVYLKKFKPSLWIKSVSNHKITFTISVSSHLYALKDLLFNQSQSLKSLKTIVTSSAPIDTNFKLKLFESIGCDFYEIYGTTEVAIATNLTPSESINNYKTVGQPCKNVDIKILDSNQNVLPIDTTGEIAVSTELSFSGYYNLAELTQQSVHDGYFLTGDLGTINQQGYLSYISRKKDIIISGGINIYPKDIEDVLLKHPKINEVAVIGVEDSLLGEVIIAICIGVDINKKSEQDLYRLSNKNLAPYQRPLKYFFQDSLPLTASGKICKQDLRDRYNKMNNEWSAAIRAMMFTD